MSTVTTAGIATATARPMTRRTAAGIVAKPVLLRIIRIVTTATGAGVAVIGNVI